MSHGEQVRQKSCRDHPVDRRKRRPLTQAGRRCQHLISETRISVQCLKHTIPQPGNERISGVPEKYLLIGKTLKHAHVLSSCCFIVAQA